MIQIHTILSIGKSEAPANGNDTRSLAIGLPDAERVLSNYYLHYVMRALKNFVSLSVEQESGYTVIMISIYISL